MQKSQIDASVQQKEVKPSARLCVFVQQLSDPMFNVA